MFFLEFLVNIVKNVCRKPDFSNTPIPINTMIKVANGLKFTNPLTAVVTICLIPDVLNIFLTSITLFTSSFVAVFTTLYSD